MKRNLDGYYFRVERNGRWESVCWSDLTEEEMDIQLEARGKSWLKSMCIGLGQTIREMGDQLNMTSEWGNDSDEI